MSIWMLLIAPIFENHSRRENGTASKRNCVVTAPAKYPRRLGKNTIRHFATGQESILARRGLSGGWHEFASGFIQAPIAAFPFFLGAPHLTTVKFAEGRVFLDILNNQVSEPLPDPTDSLVAFQLFPRTRD